jgi:hypothetical protein
MVGLTANRSYHLRSFSLSLRESSLEGVTFGNMLEL